MKHRLDPSSIPPGNHKEEKGRKGAQHTRGAGGAQLNGGL